MTTIADRLADAGVEVKPLVFDGTADGFYLRADCPFGVYEIMVEYGDEWCCDFTDHFTGRSSRLSGVQDGPTVPIAAAQADYTARILTALQEVKP